MQLPPDGQPIVLLADAQTVGGYPRLGHVVAADLPRLAQLRPGDSLRFQACDDTTCAPPTSVKASIIVPVRDGQAAAPAVGGSDGIARVQGRPL